MLALVWRDNRHFGFLEAGKPKSECGQYVISYERERFHVWHRGCVSNNRGLTDRLLGEAATLDAAKAIAQAHVDRYGRRRRSHEAA